MRDYKKWTAKERNRSLYLTRKAKALGLIEEPKKCRFCGRENGILHYHNTDYDVSLDVLPKLIKGVATSDELKMLEETFIPVCRTCHMMIHRAEKNPKASEVYFEKVKAACQPSPVCPKNANR